MASRDFCMKIRFLANNHDMDLTPYTDHAIAKREREARLSGKSAEQFVRELFAEVSGNKRVVNHNPRGMYGLSVCPSCGEKSLIHEDGCEHCRNCGYSACG